MALSRALRDVMRKEDGVRKDRFANGLYENEEPKQRQRHAAGDMVMTPNPAENNARRAQQHIQSAFNR